MSRTDEGELKAILVRFLHEGALSPQVQRHVVGAAAQLALDVFHVWQRHRGYRLDDSDAGYGTTLVAPLFASEPTFPMLRRAIVSRLDESVEECVLARFRAAVVRTARQGISRLVGELSPEAKQVRRVVLLTAKKHALRRDGSRIYFRETGAGPLQTLPSHRHIQMLHERCRPGNVYDLVLATRDILAHERDFAAYLEVNQLVGDYLVFYMAYMPRPPEGMTASPDASLDAARFRRLWPGVRDLLEAEIRERHGDDPARLNGHRGVLRAVQDDIEDLLTDGQEAPHWTFMRKHFPEMTAASFRTSPLRGVFLRFRSKALSYLVLQPSCGDGHTERVR